MPTYRITGPDGRTYQVTAPEGATEQDVLSFVQSQVQAQPQQAPKQASQPDQIGAGEAALIGAGKGFKDAGVGLMQRIGELSSGEGLLGKAAMLNPATQLGILANKLTGAAGAISGKAKEVTDNYAEESELYARNSGRLGVPGKTGEVLAKIAATAPLAMAGGAGVTGGVTSGSLASLMAPTQSDQETAANVGIGAAIGAAVPIALEGMKLTVGNVRALADKLKAAMPNVSKASREQAAAKMIRDAMANPQNIAKAAAPQQFIAGTQQTLAEATDDAGLAGLQRTLQSMSTDFNNRVGSVAQANNTARVEAIRQAFGGADDASARAIEQARDKATAPLLAAARKVKGVDTQPVVKLADRILKAREGNDTVTGIVGRVRDLLSREGMDDVQRLHNARQEIGNILSGLSPEQQAGKAATNELLAIRKALDAQIGKASPEFRQFLKQYADMSKDAGRVRMGEELLGKSFANLDANGNPILSPAQFARASDNLDRVAKQATGFKRESAERLLTGDQRNLIGALRSDLDRVARLNQGKAVGSNTVQNATGAARVQDAALGGQMGQALLPTSLNGPLSILNGIRQQYGEKTLQIVQDAMLNPQQAAQLLSRLPPQQQQAALTLLEQPQVIQAFQAIGRFGPAALASGGIAAADGGQ